MHRNTHGGKRKGSGRPKGEPNAVLSVTIKEAIKKGLIQKYGSKELTRLVKDFLNEIHGEQR